MTKTYYIQRISDDTRDRYVDHQTALSPKEALEKSLQSSSGEYYSQGDVLVVGTEFGNQRADIDVFRLGPIPVRFPIEAVV